ncbi:MAG: hypothetical protein WC372_07215 [Candidatus Neomarinimicrobiota bacterium]|jgi:hypothetical protein|nr:hypothetical protein [Candidatus Neomarinimicrobiota bacterium]MDD3966584.1 hypothetical protein [Candidatus Neomarinimicrobiota bacterium]MDX9780801.1 hypothetical protein [bacterium]
MKKRNLKRSFVILLLCFSAAAAMQLYVPPDDPVYGFLDRLETRGINRDLLNDIRPMLRDDIVKALLKAKEAETQLPYAERELLDYYLSEYRRELSELPHPLLIQGADTLDSYFGILRKGGIGREVKGLFSDRPGQERRHMYIYEDNGNTVWLDIGTVLRGEGKNEKLRAVNYYTGEIAVQAGENMALYVDGALFYQLKRDGFNEPAKEFAGYWYNDYEYEHLITYDRSRAYANLTGKFGTLSLSHYPMNWGNGKHSLIISQDAIEFGALQWTKEFKYFKYTFLHGSLMTSDFSWSEEEGRHYTPKYLVAHRAEGRFGSLLHMSISEMLVYGNRIPEPTYLVPVILLWPSEHALGDRDNKLIAIDAELFPINGLKLYGTFFLDEFSPTHFFEDWWANKYAVQAGMYWAPRKAPMDLRVEWTAVHPWTYAHRYPFASYTHHGKGLGFVYGPNTRLLTADINWDLTGRHRLSLQYKRLLEGADEIELGGIWYPSGGDPEQNYEERARELDDATGWLTGEFIRRTNSLAFSWYYRWRNQISFLTGCELRNVDGNNQAYYSLQIRLHY